MHDGLIAHADRDAAVAASSVTLDGLVFAFLTVSILSHAVVLIVVVLLLAAGALRTHVN